jgi:hypothetical protein
MHLFFLNVNNKNMKKIIIILCFLFCDRVFAIDNITIDNESLIPKFDANIKKYNYFTNKDSVTIKVDDNEEIINIENDYYEYNIENYTINIYKNYNKEKEDKVYLKDLKIIGYDINFDKNIHEYFITIEDEEMLNINYELSNDKCYVSIEGNGNFNKSDNIIKINIDNKSEYIIHALKSLNVCFVENENDKNEPIIKKEIVKFFIITISCIVVFLFCYLMFNKHYFYI